MSIPIDTKHLRQVGLSPLEIQTFAMLRKTGGEMVIPEKPISIQCVKAMLGKGLIEYVQRGARQMLRLTDQGRAVAAQLEAMEVAPKIEVVQA